MKEGEPKVDRSLESFLNLLLRNIVELENLYAEEQYLPEVRPIERFARIHKIGFCYVPGVREISSQETYKFCAIAEIAVNALRDYCRKFGYNGMHDLKELAEYEDINKKFEILIALKPGEKSNGKLLSSIAYRRRLTRALTRLANLGFISWTKRKEIVPTQRGIEFRKALLRIYDSFNSP